VTAVSVEPKRAARLPPRWLIRVAWVVHRTLYSVSGGRIGLTRARPNRAGMLRLTTTGRRTGAQRRAILGYIEDGPNLVTVAMNGWGDPEPAWWLNLQANPEATVELADGTRHVIARTAAGDERSRLWARMNGSSGELDRYAPRRSRETAIVVLEPRLQP
jgi:F420H(2)-dependent quinone reductase